MQLIKSIVLVAVLAVCFVQATILSESVSLLEAHVKDAETLASKKADFVRMVGAYLHSQEPIHGACQALIVPCSHSYVCSTIIPNVNIPLSFLQIATTAQAPRRSGLSTQFPELVSTKRTEIAACRQIN